MTWMMTEIYRKYFAALHWVKLKFTRAYCLKLRFKTYQCSGFVELNSGAISRKSEVNNPHVITHNNSQICTAFKKWEVGVTCRWYLKCLRAKAESKNIFSYADLRYSAEKPQTQRSNTVHRPDSFLSITYYSWLVYCFYFLSMAWLQEICYSGNLLLTVIHSPPLQLYTF